MMPASQGGSPGRRIGAGPPSGSCTSPPSAICETDRVTEGTWLVIGVQASGKSTVADLLAHQLERGVHIHGGQFYRWAVNGWVHPWSEDSEEARRLLDLRYRLSALAANEYCDAGFTTVVQDNLYGDDVPAWLRRVTVRPRHLVVLRPTVAVVHERDKARRATIGKVAYRQGK